MKKKGIVIFGTGEIAEMAHFYMHHDEAFEHEVVAFTCDPEFVEGDSFQGLPLLAFDRVQEQYPPDEFYMHVALSYNKLNAIREEKFHEAKEKGYELISYVCSRSVTWPDLSVGENCFILENQTIQPKVKIGDNVMIWSGNHLGHGCQIKDHAYLSSHICISGYTVIGERCFIGVNSAFKDYITIGKRVFIAMGAQVTRDVADDAVVLGAKTSVFNIDSEIARKLRKAYFNID